MSNKLVIAAAALLLGACQQFSDSGSRVEAGDVIETYVEIARASYEDSLQSARVLQNRIEDMLDNPSEATLEEARSAWIAARVPYMQTEVYRFGNPVVDEWEIRVNSWPLDEGLIDYTAASYGEQSDNNYFYNANVIANEIIDIGGISVDAANITPQLLAETLHQIDGVEANVATGYHALEFLLWGQDLHGTDPGAGQRPATDFSLDNCTHGNCDRRRDYLRAATALLVSDLEDMVYNWQEGGAAYEGVMARGEQGGLATILTGMGSLSYGELAGERTRLALLLNDPEEEHDCFSDNTHNSHYYNAVGIASVYNGRYQRINGDVVSGPSLADLVGQEAPAVGAEMQARLESTQLAMEELVASARAGEPFDVLIATGNEDGERILTGVVDSLMEQTRTIESIIRELNLQNVSIEGSDSLGTL